MIKTRPYRLAISLLLALSACRSDNTNAGEVLKAFLDEFYSGRAQSSNFESVLDKYTDWPEFVIGSTTQIATDRAIRLVRENGEEATFEVRFKVIGEEDALAKVVIGKNEVIQTYRLRRRRGQWKIVQPISIPCVSVAGQLARLRTTIESATDRTLISNARDSIARLEPYR